MDDDAIITTRISLEGFWGRSMTSVSFYFAGGDFEDVLRRYDEGRPQNYQTHNEVAKLTNDLISANYRVHIHSLVTPERKVRELGKNLRIISLGSKNYDPRGMLEAAVREDDVQNIVAHYPSHELLRAALATKSRIFPVLANSENRSGLRYWWRKRKNASLLNNPRFELVANHCFPSTEQLADNGVQREKLIAWDVHRPFSPTSRPPKSFPSRKKFVVFYAGSITEPKGIGDLLHAVALLRTRGTEVECSLAGGGQIETMKALGESLGISDLLSFVGVIANTEVIERMAGADIVVVPSRKEFPEGFPLTMFEAIASRTPIVCSNHPMFRDVMIDGRNASVFTGGDPQSFADALHRTVSNPGLYVALSANASQTWSALEGPADWRTLMFKWIVEGSHSPWIRDRMLTTVRPRSGREAVGLNVAVG